MKNVMLALKNEFFFLIENEFIWNVLLQSKPANNMMN